MRDRLMVEYPEKMCEYCCNFDKEHIGMDGTALCKLTMTLAYSEDYGGNCMFYNVPKEQIIVPPCEVGQTVFFITFCCVGNGKPLYYITEGKITSFSFDKSGLWFYTVHGDGLRYWHKNDSIGINVFFTREDAEKALAERSNDK